MPSALIRPTTASMSAGVSSSDSRTTMMSSGVRYPRSRPSSSNAAKSTVTRPSGVKGAAKASFMRCDLGARHEPGYQRRLDALSGLPRSQLFEGKFQPGDNRGVILRLIGMPGIAFELGQRSGARLLHDAG